jgi:SAM-dependent methyltransferase
MMDDRMLTDEKSGAPSYGTTSRYLGEEGERYFQRQSGPGFLAAKFNEFIFAPYVSEQDEILEFGCGGGYLLHTLKGRSKVGIDINRAARAQAQSIGLTVYETLDKLPEQSFTRIITSHALEHVPNPYEVLIRLKPLLRPGGLLLWLSPMEDWRLKVHRRWKADDPDMHLYAWTPLLIGNLLVSAGYAPKSISIVTHALPPLAVSKTLWRLSPWLFHKAAFLCASIRKQRQIFVVASPA